MGAVGLNLLSEEQLGNNEIAPYKHCYSLLFSSNFSC